jgi:hypothetical protein
MNLKQRFIVTVWQVVVMVPVMGTRHKGIFSYVQVLMSLGYGVLLWSSFSGGMK